MARVLEKVETPRPAMRPVRAYLSVVCSAWIGSLEGLRTYYAAGAQLAYCIRVQGAVFLDDGRPGIMLILREGPILGADGCGGRV